MNRLPFLDWMRGLALLIMIQVHVFNSYTRMDARDGGVYGLAVLIGGMAGPMFLFMAGITFAFLMDRLEAKGAPSMTRWLACLRRAGYILAIAYVIRLTDWAGDFRHAGWDTILWVDILNSMGLAMAAYSLAAFAQGGRRVRGVLAAAIGIAAVSPLVANWNWSGIPDVVRQYLEPGFGHGHFPFFPDASYLGFGIVAGATVRRAGERLDRFLLWAALIGGGSILASQYVSNLPYSVYPKSDFWVDNPALVGIRGGATLVLMAGCFTWTTYCAGPGWSWVQCLGRNSLLVYWVHMILVYGPASAAFQKTLSIRWAGVAVLALTALMVGLSALWEWWKGRKKKRTPVSSMPAPAPDPASAK